MHMYFDLYCMSKVDDPDDITKGYYQGKYDSTHDT